ncbi:hypothetical protein E4U61_007753 [Claviceps capensis]|nr:hypothetical protein E4U61_007753 [Claviceps capensis]
MSDLASYRSTNQPTALSHWIGQNYLGPPLPANPAASGSDIESNTKPEKADAARELPRQVASSTSPENRAVDKRKGPVRLLAVRQSTKLIGDGQSCFMTPAVGMRLLATPQMPWRPGRGSNKRADDCQLSLEFSRKRPSAAVPGS